MAGYLNAFYCATNAFCGVMTATMYANEVEGVNATNQNNNLLGPGAYKYHLGADNKIKVGTAQLVDNIDPKTAAAQLDLGSVNIDGTEFKLSNLINLTESEKESLFKERYAKEISAIWSAYPGYVPELSATISGIHYQHTESSILQTFNNLKAGGAITASKFPDLFAQKEVSSATISQMMAYQGELVKEKASANEMQAFAGLLTAANTQFSELKGHAQTGVSLVSGLVQTDGEELAAGANLLSSVLASLASPMTVS